VTRRASDVIGADGRVRVLSHRCGTCIFRRGNRMHLAPGRKAEIVRANLAADALLTCHETLPGAAGGVAPAVCAGFWARHADQTICGRLAKMIIGITWVQPPGTAR
jgi:hypothetical protein